MILKNEFPLIMDRAIAIKKDKYQRWPIHIVAQAGKVFQKSGELMEAASDIKYEKAESLEEAKRQYDNLETLALETIAASLRFLERRKPFYHPDLPVQDTEQEEDPQKEIFDSADANWGEAKSIHDPTLIIYSDQEDNRTVDYASILNIENSVPESQPRNSSFPQSVPLFGEGIKEIKADGNNLIITPNPPQEMFDQGEIEQAALLLDEPFHTFTETPFPDVLDEINPQTQE